MAIRVWLSPRDVCALMATQSAVRRIKAMLAQSLQVSVDSPEVLFAMASFSKFYNRFYNACVGSQDPDALDRHRLVKVPRLVYLLLKSLGFCIFQTEDGEAPLMGPGGYPVCAGLGFLHNVAPQTAYASHLAHEKKLKEQLDDHTGAVMAASTHVKHYAAAILDKRTHLREQWKTTRGLSWADPALSKNPNSTLDRLTDAQRALEYKFEDILRTETKELETKKKYWEDVVKNTEKKHTIAEKAYDTHRVGSDLVYKTKQLDDIKIGKAQCEKEAKAQGSKVEKAENTRCGETETFAKNLVATKTPFTWNDLVYHSLNPHTWIPNPVKRDDWQKKWNTYQENLKKFNFTPQQDTTTKSIRSHYMNLARVGTKQATEDFSSQASKKIPFHQDLAEAMSHKDLAEARTANDIKTADAEKQQHTLASLLFRNQLYKNVGNRIAFTEAEKKKPVM